MQQTISTRAKFSILAVGLLSFIGILTETSLNVTFPTLIRQMNVSLSTIQWVTSGYLLMVTLVMSCTAYLTRNFNARTLFRFAIVSSVLGTLLCLIAKDFPVLMSGRLLQAISTGIAAPLMFHLILSLVPQSRLGIYVGTASMITSFAPALGPTYGGFLNYYFSWRMIFGFTLPFIFLVLILGEFTIHLKARTHHQPFDIIGFLILAVIFMSLVFGFDAAGNRGFGSLPFIVLMIVFMIFLNLLVWHFHHGQQRLLNFNILKNPIVRLRAVNYFLMQFTNIGISFVLPIFAQGYLHADSMMAGLALLPGSILGALCAPIAGGIYDRRGAKLPLLIANSFMFIGAILFWIFTSSLTIFWITLIYILLRASFNFGFGNSISDAGIQVPIALKGDVNSLFNTLQQYAGSLGTSVLAAFISFYELKMPKTKTSLAIMQGSQFDFLLLSILTFVALLATLYATKLKSLSVKSLNESD